MEAALEIAAYVLGFTLFLGVVLAAVLVKDMFFGDRFTVPHPAPHRLPTDALHEIRDAHRRLRNAYESAGAAGRQRLDLHLRRMRERLEHLEQKTIEDQSAYYKAVTQQDKAWRHWKAVHNQVRTMARGDRQRAQHHLKDAEKHFRQISRLAKDEWEKGLVRDRLNVEELRGLGLLTPDYAASLLRGSAPEVEPAPWDTLRAEPPAPPAPARPRSEDQAAGMLTFRSLREIARGAVLAWQAARGHATNLAAYLSTAEQADAEAQRTEAQVGETPPAGPWHQANLLDLGMPKTGRAYGDPTFSVTDLPLGTLAQADLSGVKFTAVEFTGVHRHLDCRYIGADLRGVLMTRQERPHQFARCDFAQADLSGARLTFLLFHRCNLSGTRWYGATLDRVKFSECQLDGVDWGGCDLSKTVFTDDAEGADWSTASALPMLVPATPIEGQAATGVDPAAPAATPEPPTVVVTTPPTNGNTPATAGVSTPPPAAPERAPHSAAATTPAASAPPKE